jgi:hypothetical protein
MTLVSYDIHLSTILPCTTTSLIPTLVWRASVHIHLVIVGTLFFHGSWYLIKADIDFQYKRHCTTRTSERKLCS